MGIIISAGSKGESALTPRFAYVWAPPPRDEAPEESAV